MERYDPSDDMKLSQRLIDKYHMIGNIREIDAKLRAISGSYEGFVGEILKYATTSRYRKEKVMEYLTHNPQATCYQVREYVMSQPDFHDALKQIELEQRLYEVPDYSSDFVIAVLNYASEKEGRVEDVLNYINKNVGAKTYDILKYVYGN